MQQLNLFEVISTLPVEYYPGFLHGSEGEALLAHCRALQWQQNEIRMLGKPLQVPRLECMYGKDGASYLYSNSVSLEALSWTPELLQLRDRITVFCGYEFDIVIGNRYRNGQDSIGWHSDDELSMGYRPAIASISLGACRKFSVKPRIKGSKSTHFWLEHGSLLLMLPGCQEGYVHQLPKDDKCFIERINLTFRPYGRLK
ncbi:alpha-ketoglutarate-dependent dioxygenase AlkB [Nostoc sp. C052]|uniref:alpha-ketoglutarate-dependent dioxygenase AlkB family protein n=1 Tax=Nostoc sp. C052 TaxID=2576902 RepID=UPI0015C3B9F2|nr:alpha-ketoglutarate-dependent dioxygenase AlkB [Nostoc sp. C052]QLE42279.1 alpha-ketoglutarate-dependent dioxygenase AlkB [Nostoc sp. C052]